MTERERMSTHDVAAKPPDIEQMEATAQKQAVTLFGTTDPAQVLARAKTVAVELVRTARAAELISNIAGHDYMRVEGWQALGAMLGVSPVTAWTRPLADGWEARVEVKNLDGRVIGAAEAQCRREEERWSRADDYAVRSMAQTRATSKALASVLRFVVVLGGVEGTPAEEMDAGITASGGGDRVGGGRPSSKQIDFIDSLLRKTTLHPANILVTVAWLDEGGLDRDKASKAIEALKGPDKEEAARALHSLALQARGEEVPEPPDEFEGSSIIEADPGPIR